MNLFPVLLSFHREALTEREALLALRCYGTLVQCELRLNSPKHIYVGRGDNCKTSVID